jgi:hypothetical protein
MKIVRLIIFLGICQNGLFAEESAVTYHFSGGRFGDNLLTYFHAKWLSYCTGYPIVYNSFRYSDQLVFSDLDKPSPGNYDKEIRFSEKDDPLEACNKDSTLIHVEYFPELSWGGDCLQNVPKFHVNWDDPNFRRAIQAAIVPKETIQCTIIPPKDRISVALHFRTGGKFEPDLHDKWALKGARLEFFIDQLKYLHDFLGRKALFVYIFTDHQHPNNIKSRFEKLFRDCDIIFGCPDRDRGWNDQVLEDFFSMIQFNCSIHGDSNFSITAGLLADYDVEIRPMTTKEIKGTSVIDHVVMRLHFDKEKNPEYHIISSI